MASLKPNSAIDASAITLSTLCIIHCLALPVVAAVLPLTTVWFEQEWVHGMFVLAALPITGYAVFASVTAREGIIFPAAAATGLCLLTGAAFFEPLHRHETVLTVTGAGVLMLAHAARWAQRHCHTSGFRE